LPRDPNYTPIIPDDLEPNEDGLVAVGGELNVDILCEAYCKGIFPWTGEHPIPWFSPDPRMILFPESVYVSRRLDRVIRSGRFEIRFDTAFTEVMKCCATVPRREQEGTWITPNMHETYTELHDLGIAHSVEAYEAGVLCGGMYGLSFGRTFCGESMFRTRTDASKVVLVSLCRSLQAAGFDMIDCQQETPHLSSMGAVSISREEFLERLEESLKHPSIHERGTPPWMAI